jgi:hypothetical protein
MKKTITFILLFITSLGYSQNLKGSLKYGGNQDGKTFSITYRSMQKGTLNPENNWVTNSLPASMKSTVFFNYDDSNKLKVIFSNGKDNILYNIRNIETENNDYLGLITLADASHTDFTNGKAEIRLTKKELQITIIESNTVLTFLNPIKN